MKNEIKTTSEALKFMGKRVMVRVMDDRFGPPEKRQPGIEIRAVVIDMRRSYGNPHLLIRPTPGRGTLWVRADRIRVVKEWPNDNPGKPDAGGPVRRPAPKPKSPVLLKAGGGAKPSGGPVRAHAGDQDRGSPGGTPKGDMVYGHAKRRTAPAQG